MKRNLLIVLAMLVSASAAHAERAGQPRQPTAECSKNQGGSLTVNRADTNRRWAQINGAAATGNEEVRTPGARQ